MTRPLLMRRIGLSGAWGEPTLEHLQIQFEDRLAPVLGPQLLSYKRYSCPTHCYHSWVLRIFSDVFLCSIDAFRCSQDVLRCSQIFYKRSQMYSGCGQIFSDVHRCSQSHMFTDVLYVFSVCSKDVCRMLS